MDEECGWGDSTKEALDHIQQQIKNQLPHREGENEGEHTRVQPHPPSKVESSCCRPCEFPRGRFGLVDPVGRKDDLTDEGSWRGATLPRRQDTWQRR